MSGASTAVKTQVTAWYRAARPRSLTATYVPIALAGAITLGDNVFNLFRFVLSLIAALALQIGANLVNEYADHVRGSDTQKVAGMGMVIKDAVLTPRRVLIGAVVTIVTGSLIGLFLVTQSGILVLWIGIIGVLVVILYTAGPVPLAYIGMGDIAVFICFGPLMVLGAYYVIAGGQLDATTVITPLVASIPVAFLVTAILHGNNMRDMEADRAANKRTLPVLFGLRFARAEYVFLVGGAYAALIILVAAGRIPWLGLVALVTVQEARRLIELAYSTTDPMTLHALQGRTARLHRDFGASLVLGWLAALLVRLLLSRIG